MYGGAIALASALAKTHAFDWLILNILGAESVNPFLILVLFVLAAGLLTEWISNTAAVAVLLPTALSVAAATGNAQAIGTLLAAGTIGAAARVYESAGVRNMLIRLGKAPKRSTLEADLKNSIPILLKEANQGIQQELTEQQRLGN